MKSPVQLLTRVSIRTRLVLLILLPLLGTVYFAAQYIFVVNQVAENAGQTAAAADAAAEAAQGTVGEKRVFLEEVDTLIRGKESYAGEMDAIYRDKAAFLEVVDQTIARADQSVQEMARLASLRTAALAAGELLHALQRERAASAAHLGSTDDTWLETMMAARSMADAAATGYRQAVETNGVDQPGIQKINEALFKDLNALAGLRAKLAVKRVMPIMAIDLYTRLNDNLIAGVAQMATATGNADLRNLLASYENLLRTKELTALEQAYLADTLARRVFGPGIYNRYIANSAAREVYEGQFQRWSHPELLTVFEEASRSDVATRVKSIRSSIRNYDPEMGFEVRADRLLDIWGSWLDRLHELEVGINHQLDRRIRELAESAASQRDDLQAKKGQAAGEMAQAQQRKEEAHTSIAQVNEQKEQALSAIRQAEAEVTAAEARKREAQSWRNEAGGKQRTALAVTAIVLLLAIGFGSLTLTSIAMPLRRLRDAFENLGGGSANLAQRLPVEGNCEFSQVSTGFNGFAATIQELVQQVKQIVGSQADAAERLFSVAEKTKSVVDRQQAETARVSHFMGEMTDSVQEVARNAENAAEAARQADQESVAGQGVVHQTMETINRLAREVESSAEAINRLKDDSEAIGTILNVIRDIAEQTNLLALNAAIEAARAGEQGRGFAVVADEVRTLAGRTQQSTQEIQQMIERLQAATRDAVTAMQQGREQAGITVEQASRANSSLEAITRAVATISEMNDHIADASTRQTTIAEEMNRSIGHIEEMTGHTVEGTRSIEATSEQLSSQAEELKGLVLKFDTA